MTKSHQSLEIIKDNRHKGVTTVLMNDYRSRKFNFKASLSGAKMAHPTFWHCEDGSVKGCFQLIDCRFIVD